MKEPRKKKEKNPEKQKSVLKKKDEKLMFLRSQLCYDATKQRKVILKALIAAKSNVS